MSPTGSSFSPIGPQQLALVLEDLDEVAAARLLLEQALASDLKTYGEGHARVARVRHNLALVRQDLGEPAAAADEI
jgi:Tetratricopeptide repeat